MKRHYVHIFNIQFKVQTMEWHLFNNKAIPQGDKDNFHKFLIGRDPLRQKGYLHLYTLCISVVLAALIREGNGTPLQYSCLENPVDRGAW